MNILWLLLAVIFQYPLSASALETSRSPDIPITNDIMLSPAKAEFTIAPGESVTRSVYVTNRLGKSALFEVSFEDFAPADDPREGVVLDQTIPGFDSSLKRFLAVSNPRFTLSHGESVKVDVEIRLPRGLRPGGLYSAVIISAVPVDGGAGAAKVITRLGSLFFVRVAGEIRYSGLLKDAYFKNGNIEILFENDGSAHLNPYGVVNIYNSRSRKLIETKVIEPWFVLPSSERVKIVELGDLGAGSYVANVVLNRGYEDIVDSKDLNFDLESTLETRYFVLAVLIITTLSFFLYRFFIK